MFADGIDLTDDGARTKKEVGDLPLGAKGDPLCRQRQQRRATARPKSDDKLAAPGLMGPTKDLSRRRLARPVRDRMPCFNHLNFTASATVAILRHDDPAGDRLAEDALRLLGHPGRSLSGAEQIDRTILPERIAMISPFHDFVLETKF